MKFKKAESLADVAKIIGASFAGDPNHVVDGINEIHMVTPGDIVFVDHPKYYDKALSSEATTILINKEVECPSGKALIFSKDPFSDFNKLIDHFFPRVYSEELIAKNIKVGKDSLIMPGVSVGSNVSIGNNCVIHPNVVIGNDVIIGNNVIVQAGTVLGSDAFYYKKRDTRYERLLSCGRLIIEDNVEIGASCTIDKGVSGDTIIGSGTIIDNIVHIAHDVHIGNMCLIAAQVGIAGATKIGNNVTIWGQVGISSDVKIGDGAVLQAQTGVSKSLAGGKVYFGSPAGEAREKLKELVAIRQLPATLNKLKAD